MKFGRNKIDNPRGFTKYYKLWKDGNITIRADAETLGMSDTTFYRRCMEREKKPIKRYLERCFLFQNVDFLKIMCTIKCERNLANMATIVLHKDKLNSVGGAINNIVTASNNLNSQLCSLKTTLQSVNSNTCDLQETINNIRTSTKTETEKIKDLSKLIKKVDEFVSVAVKKDNSVKEQIEKSKEEFYTKYSYLKPQCEKSALEKISDGWDSVCDWCAKNWESIVSVIAVIVVVAAIVVASVLTFGSAAVIAAAAVGVLVGIGCQLASDIISYKMTGDWDASWQDYVGSAVGGAVGGILMLSGNASLACSVDAGTSSFLSGHLSNLTGGEKKSSLEIMGESVFSAGLTFGLGKICEKPVNITKKWLSKNFSNIHAIKRLAGRGNYDAAFRMITTRLKNGNASAFSWKTIRNGGVAGMTDSYLENIVNGFISGGTEIYSENSGIDVRIDYSKFVEFQH